MNTFDLSDLDGIERFKQRQQQLIAASSKERKEAEKKRREDNEQGWREAHSWYEGDNQANSPEQAAWDDITD